MVILLGKRVSKEWLPCLCHTRAATAKDQDGQQDENIRDRQTSPIQSLLSLMPGLASIEDTRVPSVLPKGMHWMGSTGYRLARTRTTRERLGLQQSGL